MATFPPPGRIMHSLIKMILSCFFMNEKRQFPQGKSPEMRCSMLQAVEKAYAKLNLSLDITGTLPGGYHALESVMQSVSLADTLNICVTPGAGEIRVETDKGYLPRGEKNLAGKAARLYLERTGLRDRDVSVSIEKRIPVGAGLGGGSADAAAVLRGLNALLGAPLTWEELEELGARVGSDVPFCVRGGTVLARGRGEKMEPLPPLADCGILLCKPGFSVSTAELFALSDSRPVLGHPDTLGLVAALEAGSLSGVAHRLYNVFEEVTQRGRDEIETIRGLLYDAGAISASMSGTGPTVFGVFPEEEAARGAEKLLRSRYRDCFACRPQPRIG